MPQPRLEMAHREARSPLDTESRSDDAARMLLYDVPLGHQHDDVSAVEFVPPQVPDELVWAEMLIAP